MNWKGVIPAVTTPFTETLDVDASAMEKHCRWLLANGCTGIVALGSLGEGATLAYEEKLKILQTCRRALPRATPLVAAISALSTAEAVRLAKDAAGLGCDGLMVLPPYVYPGDWREMKAHMAAIFRATPLSCMLYNNPIAYGTDFLPEQIADLAAEHANLHALKESSTDVRRVTAIRALLGERLEILIGVDDAVLEAVNAGATGWIAGLANALPRESADLFELARCGKQEQAFALYRWFLPLLRMDTVPHFVQLIKLVQAEVGMAEVGIGGPRVRPPRLTLAGDELDSARKIIRAALASRPQLGLQREAEVSR